MSISMRVALRSIVSTLCVLLLSSVALYGQNADINTTTISGEYARYSAYYNWHFIWLNAGDVVFRTEKTKLKGHDLYKLQAYGQTKGGYDKFYYVRDTFISYVDTLTLSPLKFVQKNYEGKNIVRNVYNFDKENKRFTGTEYIKEGKTIKANGRIDKEWDGNSFDVMTMVYKARNINFSNRTIGEKIPIEMIINGQVYKLYIRYLGKETITTKHNQTFRCQKFSPLLVEGTIFTGGEDMTVWVTDDENHVPIVVEAKILIGSVKAILSECSGLRHKSTAEIKNNYMQ